jgi:hypothetical protein
MKKIRNCPELFTASGLDSLFSKAAKYGITKLEGGKRFEQLKLRLHTVYTYSLKLPDHQGIIFSNTTHRIFTGTLMQIQGKYTTSSNPLIRNWE